MLPLDQVIVLGDRKMPTEENQLAWLRLGVGYIGPTTMQDHHRQTLQELLDTGQTWTELHYLVAGGPTANLDDASLLQEWKGRKKSKPRNLPPP